MTDTIKIIESQQVFAKNVYLDFMSKRFGITPCCISDPIGASIKKQLCDWDALKRDIPTIQKIHSEIFYPASPIDPCDDPLAPDWCKDCGYFEPENAAQLESNIQGLQALIAKLCTAIADDESNIIFIENNIASINENIQVLEQQLQFIIAQREVACDEFGPGYDPALCAKLFDEELNINLQLKVLISDKADAQLLLEASLKSLANNQVQLESAILELKDTEALFCDDSECITISVIDQHGDPVENYEIILNGGNTGFTDIYGIFYHVVPNASKNTDHTLQVCYCFDTEGACRQQKITISVDTGKDKEDCTPLKSCDEVVIEKTIIGTPPSCANINTLIS